MEKLSELGDPLPQPAGPEPGTDSAPFRISHYRIDPDLNRIAGPAWRGVRCARVHDLPQGPPHPDPQHQPVGAEQRERSGFAQTGPFAVIMDP
jgi:hypothetical protein